MFLKCMYHREAIIIDFTIRDHPRNLFRFICGVIDGLWNFLHFWIIIGPFKVWNWNGAVVSINSLQKNVLNNIL